MQLKGTLSGGTVRRMGAPTVLSGCWAVPLAKPSARGTVPLCNLAPSIPFQIDLLHGEVHAERLAADLTRSGLPPRWVRLAPYDVDRPALDALAAAVFDSNTNGDAIGAPAIDRPWSVAVESEDGTQAEQFLSLFAAAQPTGRAPCRVILHYVDAVNEFRTITPTDPDTDSITPADIALERLAGNRPALCESVVEAGRALPSGDLAAAVEQSRDVAELTTRLAARLLRDRPPRIASRLALTALLGYGHRRFGSLEPALDSCADLPWWTELTGDWRRFDPAWRAAVLAVCEREMRTEVSLLGRLMGELVDDGAVDAAIELCLDAGYFGFAGDLIAAAGPGLVAAGRPLAVRRWLGRLPRPARRRHRMLKGQIQAARRQAHAEASIVSLRPVPALSAVACAPPGLEQTADTAWLPGAIERPTYPNGDAAPSLQARLLGPVEVSVCEHRVEQWHGRKGTLLLAYLLLNRNGRSMPRDVLAAALWPDAEPDASRNRLHVTMHTLRADLQRACAVPVVVYDKQGYQINPALDVWVDIEEFDNAAARGSRAEREPAPDAALAAYMDATFEYRGDLLSDHPYDDWTLLPRERYRVRMLDVLGRAAHLAYDTGRYDEAVESGQRLLALDFCREDMHRLLMRAHARLGRPHLAVRQFEMCSRQLRQELDMPPAPETVELCGQIRARSAL